MKRSIVKVLFGHQSESFVYFASTVFTSWPSCQSTRRLSSNLCPEKTGLVKIGFRGWQVEASISCQYLLHLFLAFRLKSNFEFAKVGHFQKKKFMPILIPNLT